MIFIFCDVVTFEFGSYNLNPYVENYWKATEVQDGRDNDIWIMNNLMNCIIDRISISYRKKMSGSLWRWNIAINNSSSFSPEEFEAALLQSGINIQLSCH